MSFAPATTAAELRRELAALGLAEAELERAMARSAPRIDYAFGSGEADVAALLAGLKPLVRQIVPNGAVDAVRRRFESMGLSCVIAHESLSFAAEHGAVLFFGRDRARCAEAAALEATRDHDLALARLLGYPRCCAEAYLETPIPRENTPVLARSLARSQGPLAPRLNCLDLAVFHYISWLPCSFACEPSRRYADAVASWMLARHGAAFGARRDACPRGCRHERFVADIDRALSAHRLLALEGVQVSLTGRRLESGQIAVEAAWPTAADRHPGARPSPDALHAAAALAALCERHGEVSIDEGRIVLGGAVVVPTGGALLAPFGG